MTRERKSIKQLYFDWLYSQAFRSRGDDSPVSYVAVAVRMHSIHFIDRVPNDDNRSAEGEELRDEFISTLSGIDIEDYTELYSLGKATILEVLVAFSRRCDYYVDVGPRVWIMAFLDNLGLTKYSDSRYRDRDAFRIDKILRTMNERKYDRTGQGGLFPLKNPENDQRKVELWYQMSAYMTENKMY
jgi:hypothetical protein